MGAVGVEEDEELADEDELELEELDEEEDELELELEEEDELELLLEESDVGVDEGGGVTEEGGGVTDEGGGVGVLVSDAESVVVTSTDVGRFDGTPSLAALERASKSRRGGAGGRPRARRTALVSTARASTGSEKSVRAARASERARAKERMAARSLGRTDTGDGGGKPTGLECVVLHASGLFILHKAPARVLRALEKFVPGGRSKRPS